MRRLTGMLTERTQAPASARKAAVERVRSEVDESFDRAEAAVGKLRGEMDSAIEGAFDDAVRAAKDGGEELTKELAEQLLDAAHEAGEERFDDRVKKLIRETQDIDGRFVKKPSVEVTDIGPDEAPLDTGDFTLKWHGSRRAAYGLV